MKKSRKFLSVYLTLIGLVITSMVASLTYALYVRETSKQGFYGEVNLRSYFEKGSGTLLDPYVITRPRHLYNLSRLQGMGVFGTAKHFQLGLIGLNGANTDDGPLCYADDSSFTTQPYLDMQHSELEINAIGSESVPFYGDFNGNNIEIKNLTINADPEDAGLFGYTAYESKIHNLFLDNITISTHGYSSQYSQLYNSSAFKTNNDLVKFNYDDPNTIGIEKEFTYSTLDASSPREVSYTDAVNTLPMITTNKASSNYNYKIIASGDLLDTSSDTIRPDVTAIKTFFDTYDEKHIDDDYPATTTTSLSLVASQIDNYGIEHSKVALTLDVDFTKATKADQKITMSAKIGADHGANVGLIIGHCDGSIVDCYVHNGNINMNEVNTNVAMANQSSMGLIGLIGASVYNAVAEENGGTGTEGKANGVLDMSGLYRNIVNDSTVNFDGPYGTSPRQYWTYVPREGTKYDEYLRYLLSNGNKTYVTNGSNQITLLSRKVLHNEDLGVFTIATDYYSNASEYSLYNLTHSVIAKENVGLGDGSNNYYVYYSTGEYRYGGIDTGNLLENGKPKYLNPSFTVPSNGQFSYNEYNAENLGIDNDSIMAYREQRENHIFRLKLDGRSDGKFYFSKVDPSSPGGEFLTRYFNYKLVDDTGLHVAPTTLSTISEKCGIMLRTRRGSELTSFDSSFTLETNSGASKKYCFDYDAGDGVKKYAANMINFDITTDYANVTVVASSTSNDTLAGVGVYELDKDGSSYSKEGNVDYYISNGKEDFSKPDYAFFIPKNEQLAYYDYRVQANNRGVLGISSSSGTFTPLADNHVSAKVPYDGENINDYDPSKPRLFAHTFTLPRGRYFLGSCTGTAKVYYVCAQGQDEGDFDFRGGVYAADSEVKNVDFIQRPFYVENGSPAKLVLNGDSPTERCYISLSNSNRSSFDANNIRLSFVYDDTEDVFKIDTETEAMRQYIASLYITNYRRLHDEVLGSNIPVQLFDNAASSANTIAYKRS